MGKKAAIADPLKKLGHSYLFDSGLIRVEKRRKTEGVSKC